MHMAILHKKDFCNSHKSIWQIKSVFLIINPYSLELSTKNEENKRRSENPKFFPEQNIFSSTHSISYLTLEII